MASPLRAARCGWMRPRPIGRCRGAACGVRERRCRHHRRRARHGLAPTGIAMWMDAASPLPASRCGWMRPRPIGRCRGRMRRPRTPVSASSEAGEAWPRPYGRRDVDGCGRARSDVVGAPHAASANAGVGIIGGGRGMASPLRAARCGWMRPRPIGRCRGAACGVRERRCRHHRRRARHGLAPTGVAMRMDAAAPDRTMQGRRMRRPRTPVSASSEAGEAWPRPYAGVAMWMDAAAPDRTM